MTRYEARLINIISGFCFATFTPCTYGETAIKECEEWAKKAASIHCNCRYEIAAI